MTTQTATNQSLEEFVNKYGKVTGYFIPSALVALGLDYLTGQKGIQVENLGLDSLIAFSAVAGYSKGLAEKAKLVIPGAVTYLFMKVGPECMFSKHASLDSLTSAIAAIAVPSMAASGLRYAVDNWKDKTKPAIYATGRVAKKAASKTYTGSKIAGNYALNTRAGKLLTFPIRTLTWPIRKTGNYLFKPSQSTKAPVEIRVIDTQHRLLRDISGAEIVVDGPDPNTRRFE